MTCLQKTCPLCTKSQHVQVNTEEVRIPCNTNNIGYRWLCLTCKERNTVKVYEGESGRSARTRGAKHLNELEKKKQKVFSLSTKWLTTNMKTRQANEAIRIYSRPPSESLNSKSEFHHPPHARVIVEKKY